MPWARRLFKGNKVFAQVDQAGELVVDEAGLVEIRYREDDERSYKTRPDRLGVIGGETTAATKARGGGQKPAGRRPDGSAKKPADRSDRRARGSRSSAPPVAARPRPGALVIYTDGACTGNPGPAGIGAVLLYGGHRREISEYLGEGTNNIAELTAVLRALESVKRPTLPVDLCTDSEYTIGMLARGWKAKANQDLIERIHAQLERFRDLRFVKVPAHSGVPENERADELARDAIRRAVGGSD